MKWFINSVFAYSPINAKAKELGQWVESYRQTLLPDDLSKDAFIEEARVVVSSLNEKYPRTKPFVLERNPADRFGVRLSFSVKSDIKTIAYMDIVKVLQEFHFRELAELLPVSSLPCKKGGL